MDCLSISISPAFVNSRMTRLNTFGTVPRRAASSVWFVQRRRSMASPSAESRNSLAAAGEGGELTQVRIATIVFGQQGQVTAAVDQGQLIPHPLPLLTTIIGSARIRQSNLTYRLF